MWPLLPSSDRRLPRCGDMGAVRTKKCAERVRAERAGELLWDATRRGYVLTDAPRRDWLGPAARYYGPARGIESHAGEPLTWADCPYCGGPLLPPDTVLFGGDDGEDA